MVDLARIQIESVNHPHQYINKSIATDDAPAWSWKCQMLAEEVAIGRVLMVEAIQ